MKSSLLPLIALLLAALPAFAQKDVGDRVRVLRSIVIDAGESAGDVICFGCSVRVRGQVQTDVVSIGGSVEVEGSTESDVVAIGGGIRLGPGAKIGGDAVAVGGYVTQDPGAQVAGETVPIPYIFMPGQRQLVAVGILTVAAMHLGLVLLCYAILRQRRARNVALALSKKPWRVLLAGVGGWLIICGLYYVSELISETRLGVNAGDIGYGLITLIVAVVLLVGVTGISIWLGGLIARGTTPIRAILAGSVVILVLEVVPVVGFAVFLAVALLAMGTAIMSRFGWSPGPESQSSPGVPVPSTAH